MAPQQKDPDIPELYQSKRNWRLIELIVASVLLAIVIGFVVWYFFFNGSNTSTTKPPFSNNGTVGPSDSHKSHKSNKSNGSSDSSETGSLPGNTNGGVHANRSGGNSQLTNTGPGDVIALFIGASAISALAYNFKLRKSLSR